jgi:hypothetical protein
MKLKTALLAGFLALVAGSASAQTSINITGSTAFRAAAHSAIKGALTGLTFAYTGTSESGADSAIYKGTLGSNPVIIRTNWSGSAEGITDLATPLTGKFLSDTGDLVLAGTPSKASPDSAYNELVHDTLPVHFAFSDVGKAASDFPEASILDYTVGVVPFRWVCSLNAPAALTNITEQQVRLLYSVPATNGSELIKASLFTGNSGDTTPVANFGRNSGSGTRRTAMLEARFGVFNPVEQYGGSAPTFGPTFTLGARGNGGVSSGGTLGGYIRNLAFGGGVTQVETATVVAAAGVTADGTLNVTVTGAGITGSPKVIPVALTVASTTATSVATAIRTVLAADTDVNAVYTVTSSAANVVLTRKTNAADDATLDVSWAADVAGVSALASSVNTTAGIAPGSSATFTVGSYSGPVIAMTYLGTSDSTGSLRVLSYNGETYSETNVIEGRYTLWGYQHLFQSQSFTGGDFDAFRIALTDTALTKIDNYLYPTVLSGAAGISSGAMKVTRPQDGALVTP